jgi:hypothetical protein
MSLETVFNSLAGQQEEETGAVRGMTQAAAQPPQAKPPPAAPRAITPPRAAFSVRGMFGGGQPSSPTGIQLLGGAYSSLNQ